VAKLFQNAVKPSATAPTHDTLLNRFREVRAQLTASRQALAKQHKFGTEIATAFRIADEEVWRMSQEHDRQKSASEVTSAATEAQMARLDALSKRWTLVFDRAIDSEPTPSEPITAAKANPPPSA